jgi:hypothetical protein
MLIIPPFQVELSCTTLEEKFQVKNKKNLEMILFPGYHRLPQIYGYEA